MNYAKILSCNIANLKSVLLPSPQIWPFTNLLAMCIPHSKESKNICMKFALGAHQGGSGGAT